MADLIETATWETGIYKIATTDAVIGGDENAIDNRPHSKLANRTQYLKGRLDDLSAQDQPRAVSTAKAVNAKFVIENSGRFADVLISSATTITLDATAFGKLYILTGGSGNVTITLPELIAAGSTYKRGQGIAFRNLSNNAVTINRAGTNQIYGIQLFSNDAAIGWEYAYLMPGEELFLVEAFVGIGRWYPGHMQGNFNTVGEVNYLPSADARVGYLPCKGQLVSRANYPRLYRWASMNNAVIADADWSAGTTPGNFTHGDGNALTGTTFRLPDLRGLFIRGLDDSAGIDTARTLGSYQADELAAHTHTTATNAGSLTAGTTAVGSNGASATGTISTGSTGDTETRPVNVALMPFIKY